MMWISSLTFLSIIVGTLSANSVRFTNVECQVLDKSYVNYKECDLKVVGRGIIALNVHAHILQDGFNNASVNLSLWRKYNGYRPFMFNKTVDLCKFMGIKNKKLSFEKVFYDAIAPFSNVNHSCPYNHDIIIRNLVFKEDFLKFLPLPTGEYKVQLMAATNNHWKTNVNAYFKRVEDLLKSK